MGFDIARQLNRIAMPI